MGETDYHTALYLCREIRRHFEELAEENDRKVPGKDEFVRDLEKHLGMELDRMILALKGLEAAIDARDSESILGLEPMIDSLVDFLEQMTEVTGRGSPRPQGIRMQELKTWRESTGKLAQLLCQSIE